MCSTLSLVDSDSVLWLGLIEVEEGEGWKFHFPYQGILSKKKIPTKKVVCYNWWWGGGGGHFGGGTTQKYNFFYAPLTPEKFLNLPIGQYLALQLWIGLSSKLKS